MMTISKVLLITTIVVVLLVLLDEVNSFLSEGQRQYLAKNTLHNFFPSQHFERSKSQPPASSLKRLRQHGSLPAVTRSQKTGALSSGGTISSGVWSDGSNGPKRDAYSFESLRAYPPAGPPLLDWRKIPNYPKVRDQNRFKVTGACWAFSSVSVLEILYSWKYEKESYFSYQQLIDCCPNTSGCYGGSTHEALRYLVDVGVTFEENYPFVGADKDCRSDFKIVAKAKNFTRIANNEVAMVEALRRSPLAVSLHCPGEIESYRGGVADPKDCRNDEDACSHAVVIVGHGEDYWIIRNTRGETFGDLGHYLLKKGTCAVGHKVWSVTLDGPPSQPHDERDQEESSEMTKMDPEGIVGVAKTFKTLKSGICSLWHAWIYWILD